MNSTRRARKSILALALAPLVASGCSEADTLPTGPGDPETPSAFGTAGRIAFASTRDGEPHVYVIDAGGAVQRLVRGQEPAWSPDGTQIAFAVHEQTLFGTSDVRVIDIDGTNERVLATDAASPAWSPDGARIAFVRSPDIYVVNADGSGLALLLDTKAVQLGTGIGPSELVSLSQPTWSPDGTSLAFTVFQQGQMRPDEMYLAIAEADGSMPRTLSPLAAGFGPAWSPDGTRLAFASGLHPRDPSVIATVAPGGGEPVHAHGYPGWDPDWSPDGTTIVFSRFRDGCAANRDPCPSEIWVAEVASGRLARLVPAADDPARSDYLDFDPAWSTARE